MRTCAVCSLFCILMIFDDVFLMPETIAIEYCFSMTSEDRDDHDQIEHYAHTDPGHRCQTRTPFMAGLSYIAPPQKSPWEHDCIACYIYYYTVFCQQGPRRVFKSGPAEETIEGESTRGGLFPLP